MIRTRKINIDGQSITLVANESDRYLDSADPDVPFLFALSRIKPNDVVLDVGANIGMTAVAASKRGAVVNAFEPDPNIFPYLMETIRVNDAPVTAHKLALGSEKGELSFFSNPVSGSASHLVTADTLGQVSGEAVQVSTVDAFAEDNGIEKIDLIKIDVEGFEIDVLRGANSSILRCQPAALVEFNSFTMVGFRDINPRDLLRHVRDVFPYVYWFRERPMLIENDSDALGFIHENLVSSGCVDDLYCTFEKL